MNKRLTLSILAVIIVLTLFPIPSAHGQANSRTFPETGKTVKGTFLAYWDAHGGLDQQGLPITEEFQEVNLTDNNPYTVQYFERAVFELHPKNTPPHDVLLSLLGRFELDRRYAGQQPGQGPTETPKPVDNMIAFQGEGWSFTSYKGSLFHYEPIDEAASQRLNQIDDIMADPSRSVKLIIVPNEAVAREAIKPYKNSSPQFGPFQSLE